MKKQLFSLLLIFCVSFLSAQKLKPLPDCKDMKEKIVTIQKSFDKLAETFKGKETGKEGSSTIYSSDFRLCGENGVLIEYKGEYGYKNLTFKFVFKLSQYNSERVDFDVWGEKILAELKQVFGKWYFEKTQNWDEDGNATFYTFSEKGDSSSTIKKNVRLYTFAGGDLRSIELEFRHCCQ
jgi:hypothetical protein